MFESNIFSMLVSNSLIEASKIWEFEHQAKGVYEEKVIEC
jgi:hypothetical protein